MISKRGKFAAAVLGSQLYVLGGYDHRSAPAAVERYDTRSTSWSKAPAMSCERADFAAAVAGGMLYAIGGMDEDSAELETAERFDPRTGTWSEVAPMSKSRCGHCAVSLEEVI